MARSDDDLRPDARWSRAHTALRRAALHLAAERPLHEVSLSAVATEAGVSRSTAYEHAHTTRDLVEEALVEELDEVRARHLVGITAAQTPAATIASTLDVVAHIERHADVYTRGLAPDAGAGSLHGMLAAHFAVSVHVLLDAQDLDHGMVAGDAPTRRAIDEIVVRGIANSTVGQIAAWLTLPAPRDPRLFLAINQRLLPDWWPKPVSA